MGDKETTETDLDVFSQRKLLAEIIIFLAQCQVREIMANEMDKAFAATSKTVPMIC